MGRIQKTEEMGFFYGGGRVRRNHAKNCYFPTPSLLKKIVK